MPSVMYLKYLKITGYSFDSQGKFEYAVCLEAEKRFVLIARGRACMPMDTGIETSVSWAGMEPENV